MQLDTPGIGGGCGGWLLLLVCIIVVVAALGWPALQGWVASQKADLADSRAQQSYAEAKVIEARTEQQVAADKSWQEKFMLWTVALDDRASDTGLVLLVFVLFGSLALLGGYLIGMRSTVL